MQKRLSIHPSFECNLACPGCYLTEDIPQEIKDMKRDINYFSDILEEAAEHGFTELAMSYNPHKEGLLFTQVLTYRAKHKHNMKVNVTTVLSCVKEKSPKSWLTDTDILSISVDENRFNSPEQVLELCERVVSHLRDGFSHLHINCNLTYTPTVFEWVKQNGFVPRLREMFDSVYHLVLKPITLYESPEWFYTKWVDLFRNYPEVGVTEDIDGCVAHHMSLANCGAGSRQIDINPTGWLSICPYREHEVDVSTREKFKEHLDNLDDTPMGECHLITVERP